MISTGENQTRLDLSRVFSFEDLKEIKAKPESFRGDWLVGAGWHPDSWKEKALPSLQELDTIFSSPILLLSKDWHSALVNSKALQIAGVNSNSSLISDSDLHRFYSALPMPSNSDLKIFVKRAVEYFLARGFTHIRDMSTSLEQWQVLCELSDKGQLPLYFEGHFILNPGDSIADLLQHASSARGQGRSNLRLNGIKIFYDGSLGSGSALLSQDYQLGCNCAGHRRGLQLWTPSQTEKLIHEIWSAGFDVAVHALGDQACAEVTEAALQVQAHGIHGALHLEHAQILSDPTIQKLQILNKISQVRIHMQPVHYLSDKDWLEKKLGSLAQQAFAWEKIRHAGLEHSWGSDSPIEAPSVKGTLKALRECQEIGIPKYEGNPWLGFQHPDPDWGSECVSEFLSDGEFVRLHHRSNSKS
jgi:predicted amidohydrolase YtcJ